MMVVFQFCCAGAIDAGCRCDGNIREGADGAYCFASESKSF